MDARATLAKSLKLPSGLTVGNRLAKAAMTEGLADKRGRPSDRLIRLYRAWGQGGSGLLFTGNVMVDAKHLERPGNVVIAGKPDQESAALLKEWASASKAEGAAVIMQLGHSGRQTQKKVNPKPKAPSAIPVRLPGGQFGHPVALSEEEIDQVHDRFVAVAKVAKDTGFDGVQVHAAHGYLLSEFLSPRANQRVDQYGGSLENRARLLRRIVASIRKACGKNFTLSVKLNSADFQRGGFDFEEALQVAQWLEKDGIDLLEISGGTYEQPKMLTLAGVEKVEEPSLPANTKASTREREAYFLEFAAAIRKAIKTPLMVTGGFRSAEGMAEAVKTDKIELIGIGRPLAVDPDASNKLLEGHLDELERWEKRLRDNFGVNSMFGILNVISGFAIMSWYYGQLTDIGRGRAPNRRRNIYAALWDLQSHERSWLEIWKRKGPAMLDRVEEDGAKAKPAKAKTAKPKTTAKKPAAAKPAAAKPAAAAKKSAPAAAVTKSAPKAAAPAKGARVAEEKPKKAVSKAPAKKASTDKAPKAAPKPAEKKDAPAAKAPKAAPKPAEKKDAPAAKVPAAKPAEAPWPGMAAVRKILEAQAAKGQAIGYGDAVKALGRSWSVTDKPKLEKDLIAISQACRDAGEPDLAVLVQSGKGIPGTAYFKALPGDTLDDGGKAAHVATEMAKLIAKYKAA